MKSYLKIDNVSKSFGEFKALDGISLDIAESEFVCFLGPSGCGKTTLLRTIAGLAPQSSGRIYQGGVDISPLDPSQRDFGIVFQSYALFPNLTVAQNIEFGLRSVGRRGEGARRRVAELLVLVGMSDQARKYPAQLSGGQQQRVALARALALEPGLLLLDEPLSALDAQVRVNLRNELKALQRQVGVTTIIVTHDQEEALAIADRVVVMNQGKIEQYGTPKDIYRTPATPFVASFIGEMNFLQGVLHEPGKVAVGSKLLDCPIENSAYTCGSSVTLCIRPEDIILRTGANCLQNTLTGKVGPLHFMGSFFRIPVEIAGSSNIHLSINASANAVYDLQLASGLEIPVQLPPDRLRVFPRFPQQKAHVGG